MAAPRPFARTAGWLAWCTWDHPDMPWDATTLRLARLSVVLGSPCSGRPAPWRGSRVAVGQPRWTSTAPCSSWTTAPAGGSPTGWRRTGSVGPGSEVVALVDAPPGVHGPDWVFGQHTFDELADGSLGPRYGHRPDATVSWSWRRRRPAPDGGAWVI